MRHGGTVFVAALLIFIAALSFFVGAFEWNGKSTVRLALTYHFLVVRCESATVGAVAGEAYLAGGAGYLLENENLVVLAGYYRKEDAAYVGDTMSANGVEVSILTRPLDDFSTGREHAAERAAVAGNLKTLDAVSRLLFDAANGLERGSMSQEEARTAVRGAADSLKGLAEGNGGEYFGLWNVELLRGQRRARELSSGLMFAKDLRYLQVSLLFTILRAPAYFS